MVRIVGLLKIELGITNLACSVEVHDFIFSNRGLKDVNRWATNLEYSGKFLKDSLKNKFIST